MISSVRGELKIHRWNILTHCEIVVCPRGSASWPFLRGPWCEEFLWAWEAHLLSSERSYWHGDWRCGFAMPPAAPAVQAVSVARGC